jgi:hypothetical protein
MVMTRYPFWKCGDEVSVICYLPGCIQNEENESFLTP